MSEKNRNRSSYRSDENWEQQQRRRNQPQHQSDQQYGNQEHSNFGSDYYRQSRPDYGSGYGTSGGYENTGQGGYSDYGGQRSDYNRDHRYGQSNDYGGSYGNRDRYQGNYGQQQSGYGQSGQYGRNEYRTGHDYPGGMQYGNRYGTAGEQSVNYNRDFDRDRDYDRHGTGYGNYAGYANQYNASRRDYQGNQNRDDEDRGWWDKTRDEVSSWFGDEDAERRRRMDHMTTHRGKGPKDYRRSDDRIREDVCDRLSDDPYVDASGIDVKVTSAEVTLTGTVGRREDKRRAEDLVESISGVSHVQNNLRVGNDTSSSTSPISGKNRAEL